MFLVRDETIVGDAPIYLITGELMIWIRDVQTVAAMRAVGIPQLQMSPQDLLAFGIELAPPG